MINRLGKQVQLSPWYIPYGGLEDRGLLQCHPPAASLQLGEQLRTGPVGLIEEQYSPGRAKSPWRWGLELALRCRIFPDFLPQYVPNPIAKSGLAFIQAKGASLCSNMAQWTTWVAVWPLTIGNFLSSPPSGSYF